MGLIWNTKPKIQLTNIVYEKIYRYNKLNHVYYWSATYLGIVIMSTPAEIPSTIKFQPQLQGVSRSTSVAHPLTTIPLLKLKPASATQNFSSSTGTTERNPFKVTQFPFLPPNTTKANRNHQVGFPRVEATQTLVIITIIIINTIHDESNCIW